MDVEFDSEPVYGDNDMINTQRQKQKHTEIKYTLIFMIKKYQRKMHHTNVYH